MEIEGPLVKAWWVVSFWQYTRLTAFGAWVRHVDERNPESEATKRIREGSDLYVVLCSAIATASLGASVLFGRSTILTIVASVLGAYRLYELVFAQLYFLTQSRVSKVASFTRSVLFQGFFAWETVAYCSAISIASTNIGEARAVFEGFRSLTLQADTLSIRNEFGLSAGLAFSGANVAGILLLLGVLPMLVGTLSGTWKERREI